MEKNIGKFRVKLRQLGQGMQARAIWARQYAAANPGEVHIDDEFLPWVFNDEEGVWLSFDGNYSRYSPDEKIASRQKYNKEIKELNDKGRAAIVQAIKWSKLRELVLKRDGYTCQICGKFAATNLHIHHILKRDEGGEDVLDNLITVCPSCHPKADRTLYNPEWE